MPKRIPADDAFEQALSGGSPEASESLERLVKLAKALQPEALPGPGPQFRARLRNELLAAAAQRSSEEEELFAALLDGTAVSVPAEMRPLVAVASALAPGTMPLPDPVFRYRLRSRLVHAAARTSLSARAAAAVAGWNIRMRRSLKVVTATGLAVLMMLGAGASMAASRKALPGDLLYPLKRLQESAQLVGSSGEQRGLTLLGLARIRIRELDGLLARGEQDSGPYTETLNDMDEHTLEGSDLLIEAYKSTRDTFLLSELESFAREQAADLTVLVDRLPPAARPIALDSLTLVDSIAKETLKALALACSVCPEGFASPVGTSGDGPIDTTPRCACEQVDESGSIDEGNGAEPDDGGTTRDPNDPEDGDDEDPEVPDPDDPAVDIPDPTGTLPDEAIEDAIDEILEELPVEAPSPLPTGSGIPLPL